MKDRTIYSYKARLTNEKIAIQTLKDCHAFLEKKLGVKTSLYLLKDKRIGTKDLRGAYNHKINGVMINLCRLRGWTIEESISVLAHEMRHAVQYKNNWIEDYKEKNHSAKWKGKIYNVGYYDSPWEKDARKYEQKYTKLTIESLNLTKKSKIKI